MKNKNKNLISLRTLILSALIMITIDAASQTISSGSHSYNIDKQKEWVQLRAIPKAKNTLDQSIQYLLIDEQLNLTNNNFEHYFHNAQKVISEQGLKESAKVSLYFSPDYQTLTIHNVRVIRNKRAIDHLQAKNIELIRQENEISNVTIHQGKLFSKDLF